MQQSRLNQWLNSTIVFEHNTTDSILHAANEASPRKQPQLSTLSPRNCPILVNMTAYRPEQPRPKQPRPAYILRLWREPFGESKWRASLTNIKSRKTIAFQTVDALLYFLDAQVLLLEEQYQEEVSSNLLTQWS